MEETDDNLTQAVERLQSSEEHIKVYSRYLAIAQNFRSIARLSKFIKKEFKIRHLPTRNRGPLEMIAALIWLHQNIADGRPYQPDRKAYSKNDGKQAWDGVLGEVLGAETLVLDDECQRLSELEVEE